MEPDSDGVLDAALEELRRATEDLRRLIREVSSASSTNDEDLPDPDVSNQKRTD